jgi:hypothetical protein
VDSILNAGFEKKYCLKQLYCSHVISILEVTKQNYMIEKFEKTQRRFLKIMSYLCVINAHLYILAIEFDL